jgi:hypothetical protein
MRKLEVAKYILGIYAQDYKQRSMAEGGACAYTGLNNTHCAAGQAMTQEALDMLIRTGKNSFEIPKIVNSDEELDEMMKPEYRGLGQKFWWQLQCIHDGTSNFDEFGITQKGLNDIERYFFKEMQILTLDEVMELQDYLRSIKPQK